VVCHCDDAGLEIRASGRDRSMKIVGEGRNSAAAWKMVADKSHTLKRFH
jgi:hypothetical protein